MRNRAIIPFQDNIVAELFFFIGFGIQGCFQYFGGEFVASRTSLLCEAGNSKTDNECKKTQQAWNYRMY